VPAGASLRLPERQSQQQRYRMGVLVLFWQVFGGTVTAVLQKMQSFHMVSLSIPFLEHVYQALPSFYQLFQIVPSVDGDVQYRTLQP